MSDPGDMADMAFTVGRDLAERITGAPVDEVDGILRAATHQQLALAMLYAITDEDRRYEVTSSCAHEEGRRRGESELYALWTGRFREAAMETDTEQAMIDLANAARDFMEAAATP